MTRVVITYERSLPVAEVSAHLSEATVWVHNRINELATRGYKVEVEPTVSVVSTPVTGEQTLLAQAVMNSEAGRKLLRR